jgi:hypothetical protein
MSRAYIEMGRRGFLDITNTPSVYKNKAHESIKELPMTNNEQLKSTINTPEIAAEIKEAFKAVHNINLSNSDVFFEHGQWWVTAYNGEESRAYSVVDAEADTLRRERELGIHNGFMFEDTGLFL